MTEKEKPFYRLDVTLSIKRKNGVMLSVSSNCADWELVQKFLSDFENTLLKGNNGKT
jgi:hypothetical protein